MTATTDNLTRYTCQACGDWIDFRTVEQFPTERRCTCGSTDLTEIISRYTREDAISDGIIIDAQADERYSEVSRQHAGAAPISMTQDVDTLITKAVNHPRWLNDFAGVWHDVMSMMSVYVKAGRGEGNVVMFRVIITGTGRVRNHWLKATVDGDGLNIALAN